jgi:RNA polymerase-binding transcription factor DksA
MTPVARPIAAAFGLASLPRMNPDEARQRLEAEKTRVSGLINELHTDLDDEVASDESEPNYDQHPADSGSDVFEREKDLSILDSLETELAEIEAAIERIDQGTYGIDEVTGAPIDPERLEAVPVARTNIDTAPEAAG